MDPFFLKLFIGWALPWLGQFEKPEFQPMNHTEYNNMSNFGTLNASEPGKPTSFFSTEIPVSLPVE